MLHAILCSKHTSRLCNAWSHYACGVLRRLSSEHSNGAPHDTTPQQPIGTEKEKMKLSAGRKTNTTFIASESNTDCSCDVRSVNW